MSNKAPKTQSSAVVNSGYSLCSEIETEGFDYEAGQTWIYPSNYPEREYQFAIIQQALLKNTLVSLPTGLGKTFIAAVIMYNFYRWYPLGKIIFMAPTRPLVRQQIDACYNITAIPKETTVELTGTKAKSVRMDVWNEKRVFFVTPQILQNDLNAVIELGAKIKCLVFDEAHKAKGNHAYCEIIRKLKLYNSNFRVLALSATPGSTLDDVLEVIKNLLIAHVELRTDETADVKPYTFERSLETIVVPLDGKLKQIKKEYMRILEMYTRILIKHRVIHGNCSTLTKGRIFLTMKEYQQKQMDGRDVNYGEIMRVLNISVTLYHGFELLVRHGLRTFLVFFEEHIKKPLLRNNTDLCNIMCDVRDYLGAPPVAELLPDGSVTSIPESTKFGHPKFYKLRDILLEHFSSVSDTSTRAIVFFEYKDSVLEAFALLTQHQPLIRPLRFVGQGTITQRQQINVIKAFREGVCNTLLSTCIGEEGLDVGDVDLIVCFDISNRSPIRMIQRMGRTGRKRNGRVVVLVTEGKEQQTLKECLIQKHHLAKDILRSGEVKKFLYVSNPRMVPLHIEPKCQKMQITITKIEKAKKGSLKDLFNRMSVLKSVDDRESESVEIIEIIDRIPKNEQYWNKVELFRIKTEENAVNYVKYMDKQRNIHAEGKIAHSATTSAFVSLLQLTETKHYNIPVTKEPKQSDIRNMFVKASLLPENTEMQYILNPCKHLLSELEIEIKNYLSLTASFTKNNIGVLDRCGCKLNKNKPDIDLTQWLLPDLKIFDGVDEDSLYTFKKSFSFESQEPFGQLYGLNSIKNNTLFACMFETSEITSFSNKNYDNAADVHDCEYEPEEIEYSNYLETATPHGFNNIFKTMKSPIASCSIDAKIWLEFFNLKSIDDLFEPPGKIPKSWNSPQEKILDLAVAQKSPVLLENESPILTYSQYIVINSRKNTSPKLSNNGRVTTLRNKVQKNLFSSEPSLINKQNLADLLKSQNVNVLRGGNDDKIIKTKGAIKDLADFCNLSAFGLDYSEAKSTTVDNKKNKSNTDKSSKTKLNLSLNKSYSNLHDENVEEADIINRSDFIVKSPIFQKNNYNRKCKLSSLDEDTIFNSISPKRAKFESRSCDIIKQKHLDIYNKEYAQRTSPKESIIDLTIISDEENESISVIKQSQSITVTQMLEVVNEHDDTKKIESAKGISETTTAKLLKLKENKITTKTKIATNISKDTSVLKDLGNYDEFIHELSTITPLKTTNKQLSLNKREKTLKLDSDDEFESIPQNKWIKRKRTSTSLKKQPKNHKTNEKFCHKFIEFEAEVSDDATLISDDEMVTDSVLESSFINDELQTENCIEMEAHYLESVKDSRIHYGPFKIPTLSIKDTESIFSQPVDYSQDTYLEDSFCVNEEAVEANNKNDLSELEVAEMLLKQKREQKRLAKFKKSKFRRRIFNISSDSDCEN